MFGALGLSKILDPPSTMLIKPASQLEEDQILDAKLPRGILRIRQAQPSDDTRPWGKFSPKMFCKPFLTVSTKLQLILMVLGGGGSFILIFQSKVHNCHQDLRPEDNLNSLHDNEPVKNLFGVQAALKGSWIRSWIQIHAGTRSNEIADKLVRDGSTSSLSWEKSRVGGFRWDDSPAHKIRKVIGAIRLAEAQLILKWNKELRERGWIENFGHIKLSFEHSFDVDFLKDAILKMLLIFLVITKRIIIISEWDKHGQ